MRVNKGLPLTPEVKEDDRCPLWHEHPLGQVQDCADRRNSTPQAILTLATKLHLNIASY